MVIVACALPITAGAQVQRDGVASTKDYLSKMDTSGDSRVSLPEYQDWMSYAFDAMDRNRDSVLSVDEQPGGRGKPLSRSEHRTRLAQRFAKQDLNHDGFLSARELAAPPQ
ncbi:MAG: EF-hand domain-containing protein [Thermomonas sp.]